MKLGEAHSRRQAPLTYAFDLPSTQAVAESPCEDGCRHRDRCRAEGLACASLELFTNAGRFSAFAPRQPTAAIYQRIHAPRPPRPSDEERRRARKALKVTLAREASEF